MEDPEHEYHESEAEYDTWVTESVSYDHRVVFSKVEPLIQLIYILLL